MTVKKRRNPADPRGTRAWYKLRDQVVLEEPVCWLRLRGCTGRSTTADHVIPWADRPDLAMARSNLRGACAHCNYSRGRKSVDQLRRPATDEGPAALAFFDDDRPPIRRWEL